VIGRENGDVRCCFCWLQVPEGVELSIIVGLGESRCDPAEEGKMETHVVSYFAGVLKDAGNHMR
jgi:hypothetical protein